MGFQDVHVTGARVSAASRSRGSSVQAARAFLPWPEPGTIPIVPGGYQTPDGVRQRVTSYLRVLGLGKDALVKWAANTERAAVLEAAAEIYATAAHDGPADFVAQVEASIGHARQHQKQLAKAAEIGTAIHEAIHNYLRGIPNPGLEDRALWACMAFEDWWKASGLKAVRMEQAVWSNDPPYGGTIDLVAEHPEDGLGVVDFKSSKYIYDEHHLQVAAYMQAGRRFADLRWAKIVRFPKNTEDPAFEVKNLGDMWDRNLSEAELFDAFRAAATIHRLIVHKQEA